MENLVKIFGTADEVEMQMVVNLLTDSRITCVKRMKEAENICVYIWELLFIQKKYM